ncbi:hypothetical protein K438DRAFT_2004886 [Mycena galopus ATCC 62051]|nr:hypothetical protein K438DRAFT_2004886 [Mycena galopus ATCC 62051]
MLGFPGLRELWGDEPLPPPPPGPHPFGTVPYWPPWAGPPVDAALARGRVMKERAYKGLSLPAHRFSEFSSPPTSPWWSPEILRLRHEAEDEEREIKHSFALRHRPRYRVLADPEFRADRDLLHALLACTHAVFFLRTRLQEGITAADAARIAAGPGQAALAAKEYTLSILTHDFLAAWVDRPLPEVALWGTQDDPRIFVQRDNSHGGGWGGTTADVWGSAAVWGDDGAAYGSGSAAAWGDGIGGGPRSTVIAAWGLSSDGCHGLWAGEKDDSGGDLPGCAASSAPTRNLYVNSCYFST